MRISVISLLVGAAVIGVPASAFAQDLDFYAKVYGGFVPAESLVWDGTAYPLHPGWLIGGAIGVTVVDNLSVELDATYSAAEVRGRRRPARPARRGHAVCEPRLHPAD